MGAGGITRNSCGLFHALRRLAVAPRRGNLVYRPKTKKGRCDPTRNLGSVHSAVVAAQPQSSRWRLSGSVPLRRSLHTFARNHRPSRWAGATAGECTEVPPVSHPANRERPGRNGPGSGYDPRAARGVWLGNEATKANRPRDLDALLSRPRANVAGLLGSTAISSCDHSGALTFHRRINRISGVIHAMARLCGGDCGLGTGRSGSARNQAFIEGRGNLPSPIRRRCRVSMHGAEIPRFFPDGQLCQRKASRRLGCLLKEANTLLSVFGISEQTLSAHFSARLPFRRGGQDTREVRRDRPDRGSRALVSASNFACAAR